MHQTIGGPPPSGGSSAVADPASPSVGRVAYADAGLCLRYSRARLDAAQPTALVRRVWEATAVDLLGSWSRTTETRRHLARDVCRLVGLDPESRGNRSKVGAALRELAGIGALGYHPGHGAERAIVTLPEPPDAWTDPTCGRTAGELRARRNRADDDRPPAAPPAPEPGRPTASTVTQGVGDPPVTQVPGASLREALDEEPFPSAARHAQAAPAADEGKAMKQQQSRSRPLDALDLALPDELRRRLAAPDQNGCRRTLARLVDELLADGWALPDVVASLADALPPDPTPGVLLDRARRRLDDGPPLDLDELAAQEAAEARARELDAAAGHGRNVAAIDIAAGAPPSTLDVDEEAARQYPHDPEARATFVDAYRAALARSALAEPVPSPPPPAAPAAGAVDDARARIARIRTEALRR